MLLWNCLRLDEASKTASWLGLWFPCNLVPTDTAHVLGFKEKVLQEKEKVLQDCIQHFLNFVDQILQALRFLELFEGL